MGVDLSGIIVLVLPPKNVTVYACERTVTLGKFCGNGIEFFEALIGVVLPIGRPWWKSDMDNKSDRLCKSTVNEFFSK